jgi:hypothetical protein
MKALVAQIHSLGMKIGLYGAASGVTCGTMPGTLYHEDLDAQTYADWGIDYRESTSSIPSHLTGELMRRIVLTTVHMLRWMGLPG